MGELRINVVAEGRDGAADNWAGEVGKGFVKALVVRSLLLLPLLAPLTGLAHQTATPHAHAHGMEGLLILQLEMLALLSVGLAGVLVFAFTSRERRHGSSRNLSCDAVKDVGDPAPDITEDNSPRGERSQ